MIGREAVYDFFDYLEDEGYELLRLVYQSSSGDFYVDNFQISLGGRVQKADIEYMFHARWNPVMSISRDFLHGKFEFDSIEFERV